MKVLADPEHHATLRRSKPLLFRKDSFERWEDVTHTVHNIEKVHDIDKLGDIEKLHIEKLRDIEKLRFIDRYGRVSTYRHCRLKLLKLILRIIFKFKYKEVIFDKRVIWSTSNPKEYPKCLLFDLKKNQMYLKFNQAKIIKLDLIDPVADASVSVMRPLESGEKTPEIPKRALENEPNSAQNTNEPKRQVTNGSGTTATIVTLTESAVETSGVELSGTSKTNEENVLSDEMLRDEMSSEEMSREKMLGKDHELILDLFQENWDGIIEFEGYTMTRHGCNRRYKAIETMISDCAKRLSKVLDNYSIRELLVYALDFYKKEHCIVMKTEPGYIVYKLQGDVWDEKKCQKPPVILLLRANKYGFDSLKDDQYDVELTIVGGIQFVFRVKEGVKCVKVLLKEETVWVNPVNSTESLRTLVYNLDDGTILVETDRIFKCTKTDGNWVSTTQTPFYLRHYADDGFGDFVPVYIENVRKSKFNPFGYTVDYTGVPNIELVKYYEGNIWKHQLGKPFPKSMTFQKDNSLKAFALKFHRKFIVYEIGQTFYKRYQIDSSTGNSSTDNDLTGNCSDVNDLDGNNSTGNDLDVNGLDDDVYDHYIPDITLFTGDENVVELGSDNYSLDFSKRDDFTFLYTISPEVSCTEIRCSNSPVWTRGPGEGTPVQVCYTERDETLTVAFEDKILFIYGDLLDIVDTQQLPPELTLYKSHEKGELIRLNARDYVIQKYDCEGFEYVINQYVDCTELRHNGTVVWKHREGEPRTTSFIYWPKKTICVVNKCGTAWYKPKLAKWVLTTSINTL
ncbi:hypothetical protein TpMuguga_04g00820 [Theileria parva strain Muguga]|uniref:Uncharacterized protein n=1 Tax=Theileria parva TaxID=5875 RepID=Q4N1C6_THEPA|nr:uncharacterized protein TpMuguga_04g00820 [Theileria parva strain Muguga]EAN32174.1 hypothetical protein TpMuguga_04g00820 [Theileria parva strain Muguga]|eukprot:XP_764457.1 hypothetical protein [Theileria parva strain Muguga]